MSITYDLKSKLVNIPKKPGVYEFLNQKGEVIYIGKAKNLHARVRQYFGNNDNRPQIPYLLAEAADINFTVVSNELESLYLENSLIKKNLPKYNIMLRDDKNYAFIKIDYSTQIPQIAITRKIEGDYRAKRIGLNANTTRYKLHTTRSVFFGPYSAAWKIRNTLNLVRRIFPYCSAIKVGNRPCFYYYLHRCPGVCMGKISLDEYKSRLKKIENFLQGDSKQIKKELESEMEIASSRQEYEKAGRLRDQIASLKLLEEKQAVILNRAVDWDVVSCTHNCGYVCINLFKIRKGKMFDKENFIYETSAKLEKDLTATDYKNALQAFLEKYYLEASSIPQAIYTEKKPFDPGFIVKIIQSRIQKKVRLLVPQKGKARTLVKLGSANASEYLKKWLAEKGGNLDKINNALVILKNTLGLKKTPQRIECYDISNIQGTNAVGSMVVFENGLPKKSEYRKFKIHRKSTPDDFAMMREMLTRRLARSDQQIKRPEDYKISKSTPPGVIPSVTEESLKYSSKENPKGSLDSAALARDDTKKTWPLPDLIVIDGGRGQLSAALKALSTKHLALSTIPIISLAKRIEEIFVPGKKTPIILPRDNPALQLLQRIRDEAHRFGITFHRNLRSKQAVKSALDEIPGVGPKTKKLLKQKFGTVAEIRRTKFDDLSAIVGKRIAQLIQQSL